MKAGLTGRVPGGLLLAALASGAAAAGPAPIAVTFDDLPMQGPDTAAPEAVFRLNERLVDVLASEGIPAVGFVNERKLERDGRTERVLVGALELWLDAGLELGNHTYSHPDLHRVPLRDYLADIERGARISRDLSEDAGRPYRYFRHPYLHTGRDLPTRDAVREFLAEQGFTVAPVTIDNSEWIFSAAYERAHQREDDAMKGRLGEAYVDYMVAKTGFFESNAMDLFGRPIPQVLLVHANRLNADWFGDLANELARDGRDFVTLEAALADPAYESPEEWTGSGGISWMHRWAIEEGMPRGFYAGEPETPGWVMEYSGVGAE